MSIRLQYFTVLVPLARIRAVPGLEARLAQKFPGGVTDEHLWSLSSMGPPRDVGDYFEAEGLQLREMVDGVRTWKDLCVVDYYDGPTNPCPWLEVDLADHLVWLRGTKPGPVAGPPFVDAEPIKVVPATIPAVPGTSVAPPAIAAAERDARAVTVLYAVLLAAVLYALFFAPVTALTENGDLRFYSPPLAAVVLIVPFALLLLRVALPFTLGPGAVFVHHRPVTGEIPRALGALGLTALTIGAASLEITSLWLPWIVTPILAYSLCDWGSTVLAPGFYRCAPLFRRTPLGRLGAGFVVVVGAWRVALYAGRYPVRQLLQVPSPPEGADVLRHLQASYGIEPATEPR